MVEESLWEDNPDELVLVHAGLNKSTQRQLYISTYENSDLWSISVVPSIMTRDKACRLIALAEEKLSDKKMKVPKFEIVSAGAYSEIARLLGYKI